MYHDFSVSFCDSRGMDDVTHIYSWRIFHFGLDGAPLFFPLQFFLLLLRFSRFSHCFEIQGVCCYCCWSHWKFFRFSVVVVCIFHSILIHFAAASAWWYCAVTLNKFLPVLALHITAIMHYPSLVCAIFIWNIEPSHCSNTQLLCAEWYKHSYNRQSIAVRLSIKTLSIH